MHIELSRLLVSIAFLLMSALSFSLSFAQSAQTPPEGAVVITVVYPPEFEQLMNYAIPLFNQNNRAPQDGTPPIFVVGFSQIPGESFARSSGRMMEEIVDFLNLDAIRFVDEFYSVIAPELGNKPPTVWIPASSLWLDMVNQSVNDGRQIYSREESTSIARTAVVLAIWGDRLDAIASHLGKLRSEVTITDVLNTLRFGWSEYGVEEQFGRSDVFYGRTNPFLSSTGLAITLVEAHTCITDLGFAPESAPLDQILQFVQEEAVQTCLQEFRSAIVFNDITTQFVEQIATEGPTFVDFAALSEDDFLRITAQVRQGTETKPEDERSPLQNNELLALYPSGGTFWADYPFAVPLVDDWVDSEDRQAAEELRQFLLSPGVQLEVLKNGFRPVDSSISLQGSVFEPASANDPTAPWNRYGVISSPEEPFLPPVPFFNDPASPNLPTPVTLETVQLDWCDVKKRSYIYLVLDASGSMATTAKMGNALNAIGGFVSRVDARDQVGLIVFSGDVADRYSVGLDSTSVNIPKIQGVINLITPLITSPVRQPDIWGPTALYDAILQALSELEAVQADNVVRTVVVLSDGEDNASGEGASGLLIAKIRELSVGGNPVTVFPIDYTAGTTPDPLLAVLAEESGTRITEGSPDNIVGLFSQIGDAFATSNRCPQ